MPHAGRSDGICVGRIDAAQPGAIGWDERKGEPGLRSSKQRGGAELLGERDEVQAARWEAIRASVGGRLRTLRGARSQAVLAGDLEDLGYRVSQSSVCRYE